MFRPKSVTFIGVVYDIMDKYLKYFAVVLMLLCFKLPISAQQITLKINLRGVYESKITLMPLIGVNALKPITERAGIKNGETAILSVSNDELPAEFILRFDYKEKETSTPYPSEKHIFIYKQNIELWVNPPYCNNIDSTYFQKDEKENVLFAQFTKENDRQKTQVGMLQNLLMNYDNTQSMFYLKGIEEYEKRRTDYNQWISQQSIQHKASFVSHIFRLQYVPQIDFKRSEADNMQSVLTHYFDGIDFNDTLLIKTTSLRDWMNGYVNMYGAMCKTEAMRDSLLPLAGKRAIEKAKTGNPKVYGWMVDYFYAGYEANGITKGMKMLQQFIADPNCLTSKKQQIIKRLEGMTKLVIGTLAPDFTLSNIDKTAFNFHDYKGATKYKLLLFWSADCEHCVQLVKGIKQWSNETGNKEKMDIVAISLHETDTEVKKWESAIINLPGWKHLRAKGGVNASVANDYAILSTPVMFLVGSGSNTILAIPDTLEKLIKTLEN